MVKQACREWKSKETSEGQHDCQEAFKTHFRYMVTDLKRYQSTCVAEGKIIKKCRRIFQESVDKDTERQQIIQSADMNFNTGVFEGGQRGNELKVAMSNQEIFPTSSFNSRRATGGKKQPLEKPAWEARSSEEPGYYQYKKVKELFREN